MVSLNFKILDYDLGSGGLIKTWDAIDRCWYFPEFKISEEEFFSLI